MATFKCYLISIVSEKAKAALQKTNTKILEDSVKALEKLKRPLKKEPDPAQLKSSQQSKLKRDIAKFLKKWKGTPASQDAQNLLNKIPE